MDCEQFRAIMRQHASGVTLICTGTIGNRVGLTATAVCPVTDTPPTILACVNKNAAAHNAIAASAKFSINFLSNQHETIAGIFAGWSDLKGEERFKAPGHVWGAHASGTPRLEGAIAHMDCTIVEKQEISSHTIFIGQVNEGGFNEANAPLLYFRSGFSQLTDV
ncbi:MAG: flavin reductase family protein [Pseudomonadota bacterium]